MSGWLLVAFLLVALIGLAAHPRVRRWARRHVHELLRRYRRGRVLRPKYPVVLVHGMLGFDRLNLAGIGTDYFRGVVPQLMQLGARIYVAKLPPLAGVEARASALVEFLDRIDSPRVNLIAHSMGGIDARYAISKLGMRRRVASLITIGTPHRGTPIADGGARILDALGLGKLAGAVGLDVSIFGDLSQRNMDRLNAELADADGVFYGCVLSAGGELDGAVHPLLRPTFRWLSGKFGRNDGLVPLESQRWGAVVAEVSADHWGVIGWSGDFDAPKLYRDLARELGERGL